MRPGFRLSGPMSIVILSVAALVILLGSAGGAELVESDAFSGNDGDPPDDTMWTVQETQSNDLVEIRSNQLRTYMVDAGRAGVIGVDEHDLEHFTIIVEWRWISGQGRAGEVIVHQNRSGTWVSMFNLWYDVAYHGWGYGTRSGGTFRSTSSFSRNVVNGEWYTWNTTFDVDHVNMTVKRNSNGNTIFSRTNLAADTPTGDIRVTLTTFGINLLDADCRWDNYKLYDNAATPNVRPRWLEIPHLTAIEDIPLAYNFTYNVTDPDGPLENLVITSHSPYVTAIDGLDVTFEFPNGVLTATVPLVLSDGFAQVTGDVNFTITPVNDPPEQAVPTRYEATEELPLTVDFEPHVWDIDNDTSELFLLVDDIYSSVEGLELTVEFPEGVTAHEVLVHISDGLLSISVRLNFTVVPVDDPPTIDDLGELEVIEDQERTFNITPFLHDIDTPVEDLVLIVRNRNCTIDGQDLLLMYIKGGIDDIVTIEVTDGHTLVSGDLLVRVVEVNDAPIAHRPSPKGFTEGVAKTVNLSTYIEDEDTPRSQLTLECDHPAVVSIDGFNITLLYDEWVEQHDVEFSVFDGALRDTSSFMVEVIAVNDDPVILGIGDLGPPYVIRIDEGTTEWFAIEVYDEDGNDFRYASYRSGRASRSSRTGPSR